MDNCSATRYCTQQLPVLRLVFGCIDLGDILMVFSLPVSARLRLFDALGNFIHKE